MSINIYYFSGTGNSLRVARDISERTGGTLVPIASVTGREAIRPEADVIGMVFPVYYGELPVLIKRFAGSLDDIGGKHIFAVCTFGGSAGYSLKILRKIIRARGGKLATTFQVHMPQNSFRKPWEKHEKLYATWKKRAARTARLIMERRRGNFFRHIFLAPVFMLTDLIINLMKPTYRKSFMKLSNASPELDTDELIHLNDKSFSVNGSCTGCGVCARVCPVNNIVIEKNLPVWQHRCENCLACYNWCPVHAIEGGIAEKGYYYRHPEIKALEIMKQGN